MTTSNGQPWSADHFLRSQIENELERDPGVPTTCIGISVTDHTLTLAGTVHTLAHHRAAVLAARRIGGVHAIVDEIIVVPVDGHGTSDQDIALAVERVLEGAPTVSGNLIGTVRNASVTLTGTVDDHNQRHLVYRAVTDVDGVGFVQNDMVVRVQADDGVIQPEIVATRHRADIDSKDIHVKTAGPVVSLTGHTTSFAALTEAEAIAWASPGVQVVHNDIRIG